MPIIFVLFKGIMEKSASWVSKLWSSRSSRRAGPKSFDPSTGTGATSSSANPYKEVGYRHDDDNNNGRGGFLPQVPRGAMTGLRSFVRNVGRSRPVPGTTVHATQQDDIMLTMMSADYDYHGHIRQSSTGLNGGSGAGPVVSTAGGLKSGSPAVPTTRAVPLPGPEQEPQSQGHGMGHFREGLSPDPVTNDLHTQFLEDYHGHDYLGQLRKASTIGQAQ